MPHQLQPISATDREYVLALKDKGVLGHSCAKNHEYRVFQNEFPKGVYWGCPDCDHLLSKLKHHGRNRNQILHPLGPEGGGISVSPDSPLWANERFPLDHYVRRIITVANIKNTKSVSLYSHLPCGAATLANISVPQMIELTLLGRGILDAKLRANGPFEIVPYLHVYWGEHKENGPESNNTYMICREAWMDAREDYMLELASLPSRCLLMESALA
jgi:hypothetical protein